jgi:hypothetical protein
MRNFTKLLFTGLFLLLFSYYGIAQKLQNRPQGKVVPASQAKAPSQGSILGKIDPRLSNPAELARAMQSDKFASGQPQQNQKPASTAPAEPTTTASNLNAPSTGGTTITGDIVDIKCMVTPALVKIITDAGGVLISSSKEDNIITAKVPNAALVKIAASPDVKQISQSQTTAIDAAKGQVVGSNSSVKGINSSKSIISESVLKSKGQSQAVIKTATY